MGRDGGTHVTVRTPLLRLTALTLEGEWGFTARWKWMVDYFVNISNKIIGPGCSWWRRPRLGVAAGVGTVFLLRIHSSSSSKLSSSIEKVIQHQDENKRYLILNLLFVNTLSN